MASWWLLIKTVAAVLPMIVSMLREGQIREATAAEIETAFAERWASRMKNVKGATGEQTDEAHDPNNRARNRANGLSVG